MNMEEIGYFLYMESENIKEKSYNELTKEEKVNLELNPYMESATPTQDGDRGEFDADPINIPPSIAEIDL